MFQRRAVSLVEVLVVAGIFAVLMGLLIPAVQMTRDSAIRTQSCNNLRQIVLTTHAFASAHAGSLPSVDASRAADRGEGFFTQLIPFTDQASAFSAAQAFPIPMKLFVSPADPTVSDEGLTKGMCSYPANACAYRYSPHTDRSFPDGLSSTIGFAEHYGYRCNGAIFAYQLCFTGSVHRATFADAGPFLGNFANQPLIDVIPVRREAPPLNTSASVPGKTFQVAPRREDCDPSIPQTPHRSGMQVAFADGAVRTLAPSIAESVFWSLVTPDAGESIASY